MSLVNHKKDKIRKVFDILGKDCNEKDFIKLFKTMYPKDWEKIVNRWGMNLPDMQHPDVYMKEMYRNHSEFIVRELPVESSTK